MKTSQLQFKLTDVQSEAINKLLVDKHGVEYAISEMINGGNSTLVEIRLQNGMKFEIDKSEVDDLLNSGTPPARVQYVKDQIDKRILRNKSNDDALNKNLSNNPK